MNLNKITKAELISKFKKLDAKKNESNNNKNSILNQIKSYLSQIWELVITFKSILIKLTLISFFIRIFKKYKFFRRLWLVLNSIVMSIFGLSLLDNFDYDFLKSFIIEIRFITGNIVDYLTETHFYQYLNNLLRISEKDDIKESIPSTKSKEYPGKSDGVWTPSDSPQHKVSEWLKQREKTEIPEEIKEESFNYKKYLIISGFIIGSCLVWVYFDEIKSSSVSVWDWMWSFRAGSSGDGTTGTDHGTTNIQTHVSETSESNLISPVSSDDIELVDSRRLFTSPSIENLNSEASQSWSENVGSPTGSDGSDETVRPRIIVTPPSESLLTPTQITIIDYVKSEWKNMIPSIIKAKMIFIENQVLLDRFNNLRMKSQMVSYLTDIELSTDKLIHQINQLKEFGTEDEVLQTEFILALLNDWIKQYHNIIFS